MDEPSKPEVGIIKGGRIKHLFKPTKKNLIVLSAVLVIIAIIFFWFVQYVQNPRELSVEESDRQYAEARLKQIKQNAPSPEASPAEQMTYYANLVSTEYASGNYTQATEAYQKLHALSDGKPLSYGTYKSAAQSYAKIGDVDKALSILSEAEGFIKEAASTEQNQNGYAEILQKIDTLKKDISK